MQPVNPIGNEERSNQIRRMMNVYKACSNPRAMLEMMAKSDPELQTIISLVNNDPNQARTLFYERARQLGLDDKQTQAYLTQLANSSL